MTAPTQTTSSFATDRLADEEGQEVVDEDNDSSHSRDNNNLMIIICHSMANWLSFAVNRNTSSTNTWYGFTTFLLFFFMLRVTSDVTQGCLWHSTAAVSALCLCKIFQDFLLRFSNFATTFWFFPLQIEAKFNCQDCSSALTGWSIEYTARKGFEVGQLFFSGEKKQIIFADSLNRALWMPKKRSSIVLAKAAGVKRQKAARNQVTPDLWFGQKTEEIQEVRKT